VAPLDPDSRRASLIHAAREVFAAKGYHAASVGDILEVAGVARGTFYNHFPSKREVFAAVLGELMLEVGGAVQPIDTRRDIHIQVRENLRRIGIAMAGQGAAVRILINEAEGIDQDGEEALAAFYAGVLARVERALRDGQALGVVRGGEVRQTARVLLGMLKEPVMLARLLGEPLDGEAMAEAIYGVLERGVLEDGCR
jgi:AcrR family transcriptional regulator